MPSPELAPLPEDWSRGLAVVAHPDDLEYGAASAIARWTAQGKEIAYLLVTAGEAGIDGILPSEAGALRMQEERRGAAMVGVTIVEFLDHRDGVVEYGLDLRRDIARAVRRHRPEVIITTNYDERWPGGGVNQADHRAVGLGVIDAVRDAGNRWVFPELLDEGLDPWAGATRVFVGASPRSAHAVDVTDTLDRGIASLRAHAVYLDGLGDSAMGDPGELLRGHAEQTGERFGARAAVAFELIEL